MTKSRYKIHHQPEGMAMIIECQMEGRELVFHGK
jgi:hypothetical protein